MIPRKLMLARVETKWLMKAITEHQKKKKIKKKRENSPESDV